MTFSINPWRWFHREPVTIDVKRPLIPSMASPRPLPKIVTIHGVHQSNVTFEYLRHALPGFTYVNIDWSPYGGFENNLGQMIEQTKNCGPLYLVGHSMGGIYAAHLSQHVECVGGATISSPWGGSYVADWARYMLPSYPILKEVGTRSPIITEAREMVLPGRWTNFVSTVGGAPGMGENNDCVLTLDSMTARHDLHTIEIEATHYEIVMSTEMIHSLGRNFIRASENYTSGLDLPAS